MSRTDYNVEDLDKRVYFPWIEIYVADYYNSDNVDVTAGAVDIRDRTIVS